MAFQTMGTQLHWRRTLGALFLAYCWSQPAAFAATPSFDCDRARSDVEKLICGDDELADLDMRMAKAFAKALAVAPANVVGEMKSRQKTWRRSLDDCGKTDALRDCTLDRYRRRLDEL